MLYQVAATVVEHTLDGKIFKQIPWFYLNSDVQGITTLEQAEKIAVGIINPTNNPDLDVHTNVKIVCQ